ncbi:FAD-dependent oxidoreductase [Desulfobotulus mexicanus]|uniref:FAD-dependent oxidoreductase n=1 Tax=Desulfobotulus mexicanus TaxID=2586642 RepID=A0A5Q4VE42_9BACT|nr:FAD-dependent oxidoreductase [Desulfobotulus mexicanus]TYT75233.1 FAD-dependent oxidoreductase [Desulfobotulus mexicanus]
MHNSKTLIIEGRDSEGIRLESRLLEEHIQEAVNKGFRNLEIRAAGQHGIGGRLWKAEEPVSIRIEGTAGQRLGSFGYPNTEIEVMGSASEDTGWLNAGANILVHGNAGNGTCNGMAQGKVWVAGSVGSRSMTMTKRNPRFEPPELWVLGSAGDFFGEFMAGGKAVICGWQPQNPDNVLGHRPMVGMVGGQVFFRGPMDGFSQADARMVPIEEEDWIWLKKGLSDFLLKIQKPELYDTLSVREDWQCLVARSPMEKRETERGSMRDFRKGIWDKELGKGGLIGDLTDLDMSPIPLITRGELRRFVPVWENRKYKAPCEGTCPTGIPVQQRWQLIREGRMDEAVDMALSYTPFPATVCGYLCPNPCMEACTRNSAFMAPVDIKPLGKASLAAFTPVFPAIKGRKVAVVGGGPAGISVAWQLRSKGHEVVILDKSEVLGGKMRSVIPESRIPQEVLTKELERVAEVIPHIHLKQSLTRKDVERLKSDHDHIIIATGASSPRRLMVDGGERQVTSLDFLEQAKANAIKPGKNVVIIGAGNVGCDVATEAKRLGAENITLIDIQKPAAFGVEKEDAEKAGAVFRWPCFTKALTKEGVLLENGELIPADTIVTSIGDMAVLDFLPESVVVEKGRIRVNEYGQTTDAQIFAIGDMVGQGLITDAIGAGRRTAQAICDMAEGRLPEMDAREILKLERVHLEYFDPRIPPKEDLGGCGSQCASCGNCRDCGICVELCPGGAISRKDLGKNSFSYEVDAERCIACGFCAGACPCGIWDLHPAVPVG